MKNKKIQTGIFVVTLIILATSYVLRHPVEFGYCEKQYLFNEHSVCLDDLDFAIGEPMYFYGLALLMISLLLFFFKNEVVTAWLKFGVVWTVLTAIWVSYVPIYGNVLLPIEKNTVTVFMAGLLILISLIIMIAKSIKLRRLDKELLNQ